ncbi:MAG: carbohydrate-binding family 9-like protein [Planctomycetales bacterium]|nr:carbohydrate-binding family 9-like protein [Planctomycetales bacterium]
MTDPAAIGEARDTWHWMDWFASLVRSADGLFRNGLHLESPGDTLMPIRDLVRSRPLLLAASWWAICVATAVCGSEPEASPIPALAPPAKIMSAGDIPAVTELRRRQPEQFPPVTEQQIRSLEARYVERPIAVDGRLDEADWRTARRSAAFVDLVTGEPAVFDTRVAVLWDEQCLYVGYWIQEPAVRAKFLKRDEPIWQDNDVELFIAFDHAYYELELNAHNTLYEGLFVWQSSYERHGFADVPSLDRRRPGVRSQAFQGVGYQRHPRGPRWAFLDWDFPQLRSAVQIHGTLNQSDDRDRGWTVEVALPWSGMRTLALGDKRAIPPQAGDVWRMDFSRFNQYHASPPARDSGGWALSPHHVWDSHIPEAFPKVTFVQSKASLP